MNMFSYSCSYNMESLFVIIPGFGAPHIEHKLQILRTNVTNIQKGKWTDLKIRVCCYDPSVFAIIPEDLLHHPSIEWICKKGIVGQFIHEFAQPDTIASFSYVLVILDDVELQENVDWIKLCKIHETFQFDIYHPCLTRDSKHQYKYMLEDEQTFAMKVTNACEAFCYFMPFASYKRYYSTIDPVDNPWLWGEDLCITRYNKLRVVMLNQMTVRHYYKNECYMLRPDVLPHEGFNHVMRKYNTNANTLAEMPAVSYVIFETQ